MGAGDGDGAGICCGVSGGVVLYCCSGSLSFLADSSSELASNESGTAGNPETTVSEPSFSKNLTCQDVTIFPSSGFPTNTRYPLFSSEYPTKIPYSPLSSPIFERPVSSGMCTMQVDPQTRRWSILAGLPKKTS